MKTKTFLALLLLVIAGCGCSKTDKDTSPEAVIVREISKIRVYLGDEKFGTKANNYSLTVKISGLATKPDTFLYGIVVKKLPNNANVSFNIQKSN